MLKINKNSAAAAAAGDGGLLLWSLPLGILLTDGISQQLP